MTQWRVKENDPTVAQDEADLKAFVRDENGEIAREMKYSICKSHCDGSREVVASTEERCQAWCWTCRPWTRTSISLHRRKAEQLTREQKP